MKKIFTFLFTLLFLNACGTHSASILGNGVALLTANDIPRLAVSKGTDVLIKKKTGKTAFDHLVSNNTFDNNFRSCEIHNSTELNEIFFETLDEIDCVNEITHFEQFEPS